MNRRFRLTNSSDFQRVRRNGSSFAHPLAILLACPGAEAQSRFGFTASRAIGGAVARNRTKRLLREVIRHYLPEIEPGWDVVIIARPDLLKAGWDELLVGIGQLLKRSGIRNV